MQYGHALNMEMHCTVHVMQQGIVLRKSLFQNAIFCFTSFTQCFVLHFISADVKEWHFLVKNCTASMLKVKRDKTSKMKPDFKNLNSKFKIKITQQDQ